MNKTYLTGLLLLRMFYWCSQAKQPLNEFFLFCRTPLAINNYCSLQDYIELSLNVALIIIIVENNGQFSENNGQLSENNRRKIEEILNRIIG